ncbi:MAG: TIGR01777 family oxidoreductase [Flavobacterium sp.]
MRVLITGATGLVGTPLAEGFIVNGHSVHYLTTREDQIQSKENYQGFFWNPDKSIIDESCLIGVDAIVHLAGATVAKKWTAAYKQEIIESRTLSSQLLFKTLKNHNHQVKQIVSASAIGVYPHSLDKIYKESEIQFGDDFLAKVVSVWEEQVLKFEMQDLKVALVRIGLVLSMNGGALPPTVKPIKMGVGAYFGSGKHWQSWIHIDDLVAIFYESVLQQWEGVYNGVAPFPVTNKEFTKAIATELNKPLWLPPIPKWFMNLVLGEMHQLLYSSQKVSAQKLLKNGFQYKFPNLKDALKELLQ